MSNDEVLRLEVQLIDVELGAWCERCSLPAAVLITLALVNSQTLQLGASQTITKCLDCHDED